MPIRLIFLAICTYPVIAIPLAVAAMLVGILIGFDNLAWAGLVLGITGGASAVIGAFWYFDYKTPTPPTFKDIKRGRAQAAGETIDLANRMLEFVNGMADEPPKELQSRLVDYAEEKRRQL